MRRALFVLVLLLAACQPEAEKPKTQPTSSPEPTVVSFDLTGQVIEASGSASTATSESTITQTVSSPTSSPATPTPSPTVTTTARATETTRTTVLEKGAPGSIAVKLSDFKADSPCLFNKDDTLVFFFTPQTRFEPESVTEPKEFPNNLKGATVQAVGVLVGEPENCAFVAESVTVQSGTSTGTVGRATPRTTSSPSPTKTTPTPTTKASPTG